jgi:hypothetical protein
VSHILSGLALALAVTRREGSSRSSPRQSALGGTVRRAGARAPARTRNAKSNGGDLGFIEAVGIDPAFAAAAFKLNNARRIEPRDQGYFRLPRDHNITSAMAPAQLPFDAVKSTLL